MSTDQKRCASLLPAARTRLSIAPAPFTAEGTHLEPLISESVFNCYSAVVASALIVWYILRRLGELPET